jgi:hypothetical protein
MIGTLLGTSPQPTRSAKNYGTQSMPSPTTRSRWPRHGRCARRYVVPRFPFSSVYRMREDEVEIIAVAHGRRRPGYWRSRL